MSVLTGETVAVHPTIHMVKSWETYNLNHGTSLPGTKVLDDDTGSTTDVVIRNAHDYTSTVYDMYKNLFGRLSIDGNDMTMISSVHYSTNYVNAFWNGSQMTYGDGDGTTASPLVTLDIAGHEITHGVTERTSGLIYSGESGGMNEANSDIFGAVNEWLFRGKVINAGTWMVGEDCWTPGTPNDALRYMNDPAKDGRSPDLWYSGIGSLDPHYNSGIGNLAFYMLSQGGKHPRNKTNIEVTGIGFERAAKIFFRANTVYLSASSNYQAYRHALGQAAADIDPEAAVSVTQACDAIAWPGGPPPPPPPTNPIEDGVPVTGLSGTTGGMAYWKLEVPAGATKIVFTTSGGTGDLDLYVKFNAKPTTTVNDGKSEGATTAETITINNPSPGTWYILTFAYASYSGVTLLADHDGNNPPPPPPGDTLENGVPKTGILVAKGEWAYFKFDVPAGGNPTSVVLDAMAPGKGDPDLYVQIGEKPTASRYLCRPYLPGTLAESCTSRIQKGPGTYWVGIRGFKTVVSPGATVTAKW